MSQEEIAPRFLWVLNPDAEVELGRLSLGKESHYPSKKVLQAMQGQRGAFESLTAEESSVLALELQDLSRSTFRGTTALFWCPTPSALRLARKADLKITAHPSAGVLQLVNDKRFLSTAQLPTLPGRRLIPSLEEMTKFLSSSSASTWRAKRPFGAAGRGQRRVSIPLSPDDLKWLGEAFSFGSLVLEPEVETADYFSLHGVVDDSPPLLGELLQIQSNEFHAPLAAQKAEFDSRTRESAEKIAEEVCAALKREGYFGPFGIDLARPRESQKLYALDLNARFTLNFGEGMGEKRDEAIQRILRA